MVSYYSIEPCASSKAYDIVFKGRKFNMEKVESALGVTALAKTPVVLILNMGKVNLSVYASGRIMLKNCSKEKSKEIADHIFKKFEKGGVLVKD